MGGYGSGNHCYRWNKKAIVEDCLSLDANRWMREGILSDSSVRSGSWQWTYKDASQFVVNYQVMISEMDDPAVRLSYSWVWPATGEKDSADYWVRLAATPQHFGGRRWWFSCPVTVNGVACNRRVAKLHLPPNGRTFGCRHCHELTYKSCQESRKYDSLHRFMAERFGEDFHKFKRRMNRRC
jgi:hypothetical protein